MRKRLRSIKYTAKGPLRANMEQRLAEDKRLLAMDEGKLSEGDGASNADVKALLAKFPRAPTREEQQAAKAKKAKAKQAGKRTVAQVNGRTATGKRRHVCAHKPPQSSAQGDSNCDCKCRCHVVSSGACKCTCRCSCKSRSKSRGAVRAASAACGMLSTAALAAAGVSILKKRHRASDKLTGGAAGGGGGHRESRGAG